MTWKRMMWCIAYKVIHPRIDDVSRFRVILSPPWRHLNVTSVHAVGWSVWHTYRWPPQMYLLRAPRGYISMCEVQTAVALRYCDQHRRQGVIRMFLFNYCWHPDVIPPTLKAHHISGGYCYTTLPRPTSIGRTPTEQENQSRKNCNKSTHWKPRCNGQHKILYFAGSTTTINYLVAK